MSPVSVSQATALTTSTSSTAPATAITMTTTTTAAAETSSVPISVSGTISVGLLHEQWTKNNGQSQAPPNTQTQTEAQAQEQSSADVNKLECTAGSETGNGQANCLEDGVVIKSEQEDDPAAPGAASEPPVASESCIHTRPRPVLLSAMNPHIICNLCQGYLIDATTIVECLHSFCHSCLIKHLRTEQYCPRCEMMINTAKPNIKPDTTLQAIVYKLVPGLYEKELMRKRAFYKDRPEEAAAATPEQRGDDTEHLIFGPADNMSLSLEYADIEELKVGSSADYGELLRPRYLQCPAMYTVTHLKKFVHGKFEIDPARFSIDIMYKVKTIVLLDHYTLMDVAYIYTWKRDAPMRFYFRVKECLRPAAKVRRLALPVLKKEPAADSEEAQAILCGPMTVVHATAGGTVPSAHEAPLLQLADIKVEHDAETAITATPATAPAVSPAAIPVQKSGEAEEQTRVSGAAKAGCQPVTASPPEPAREPPKHFAIVPYTGGSELGVGSPYSASAGSVGSGSGHGSVDKLKITLVSKSPRDNHCQVSPAGARPLKQDVGAAGQPRGTCDYKELKDERKVENIKLKIDLSKQNSVTIINMSHPKRKDKDAPPKPARVDKEWKVKHKKERDGGSPRSGGAADRKHKSLSPLTVPPLTIKAERISPPSAKTPPGGIPKWMAPSPKRASPMGELRVAAHSEDEQKSQFLKSFALTPIKAVKLEAKTASKPATSPQVARAQMPPPVPTCAATFAKPAAPLPCTTAKETFKAPTPSMAPRQSAPAKRKSNDVAPATARVAAKKPKPSLPLSPNDFRIRLPPSPNNSPLAAPTLKGAAPASAPTAPAKTTSGGVSEKPLMPPPPVPVAAMKPTSAWARKAPRPHNPKFAPPGSLTPHPHALFGGMQPSPPGNRTPIAKRYQPILPKAARPNPFANIPSDVNKLLKDAGTEIKSIAHEATCAKVYGPKAPKEKPALMGPPPAPKSAPTKPHAASQQALQRMHASPPSGPGKVHSATAAASKAHSANNYLNLALFNASKSRGNETPPGCRTPIYAPNSPIYSPSSPQYVPNYNIPTVPTYKYTPKPADVGSSYLQSILGTASSQMASLFPSPPTQKESSSGAMPTTPPPPQSQHNSVDGVGGGAKGEQQQQPPKRVYPFARSPSPIEDPPEKQAKVKSLLTSCNINIPSSLSITITREDGESPSHLTPYPKRKSPVNNYIEILKLPDQPPAEQTDHLRRSSPPAAHKAPTPAGSPALSPSPNPLPSPQSKPELPDRKIASSTPPPPPTLLPSAKTVMPPPLPHSLSLTNGTGGAAKQPPKANLHNLAKNLSGHGHAHAHAHGNSNAKTTTSVTEYPNGKNLNGPAAPQQLHQQKATSANAVKPPMAATATGNGPAPTAEKTTPEKKPAQPSNGAAASAGGNKSPSAPAADQQQASKKFRPILPRQQPAASAEAALPKAPAANVIGTYASPSGLAVKVHASKKVPPAKKSPLNNGGPQQATAVQSQSQSPGNIKAGASAAGSAKSPPVQRGSGAQHKAGKTVSTPPTSPAPTQTQTQIVQPLASPPNAVSKFVPHPGLTVMSSHLSPPMPPALAGMTGLSGVAGSMAPPPSPVELNKLFKENLLRAQAAAAAASQSNMLYSYAANAAAAAQLNQFTPSMYSYQQAYIMEQLSRMQRAGSEAFSEYMQKLKSGELKPPASGELLHEHPKTPLALPPPPPSPTPTSTSTPQPLSVLASSPSSPAQAPASPKTSPTTKGHLAHPNLNQNLNPNPNPNPSPNPIPMPIPTSRAK